MPERKKVYDPFLRLIHWSLALAIFVLLATAWSEELFEAGLYEKAVWLIHIYAGYALITSVTARIIWGVIGPKHAKLSDLWHPQEWLSVLKKRKFSVGERFGHHPMASLAYLGLYAVLLFMIGSGLGLAAIEHSTGPLARWLSDSVWYEDLFEEPHEALSWLVVAFIGLHIVAMLVHERIEGVPITQGMLSGYQYRIRKDRVLLLAWIALSTQLAWAGSPQEQLKNYEKSGGQFSAVLGRVFYNVEKTTPEGNKISCATCHSPDPGKSGKTRLGKVIEPMAPSVNAKRFTDPAKVEKWFKRNCNDVLGRECTPQEKGDFITYLLSN